MVPALTLGAGPAAEGTRPYVSPLCARLYQRGRGITTEDGALLAADISGFTRLTERLAGEGRVGAERLAEIISECFDALIAEVLRHGGDVLRFGGDALFVMFPGRESVAVRRAAAAALAMQERLRARASIVVPGGRVRLRMSMAVHAGPVTFFVREGDHAEVLPLGSTVSEALRLESRAESGEVRLSPRAAAHLPDAALETVADGVRLARRVRFDVDLSAVRTVSGPDTPELVPVEWRALVRDAPSEHRIASVAFVMVSDTDRSLELDPAALSARLQRMLVKLDQLTEAFAVTYLGSDVIADGVKFILVSGMPHARADDDVRLVAAVHALVSDVDNCRAGVHRGPVFAGALGNDLRRTYTVMGDTTNTAARLMGAARAGSTVVSAEVSGRLPPSYGLVALEPLRLKGKRRPFDACEVYRCGTDTSTAAGRDRIVGRRPERRVIRNAVGAARAGRGTVVEFTGPPGIGKSALLRSGYASASDALWLCGDAARRLEPLGAFPDELRAVSGASVERLVRALAMSTATPTAIFVDEVHWLDASSRAAVTQLASVARDLGWCVVVARRSDEPTLVDESTRVQTRELGLMSPSEMKTLILDHATRPLTDPQLAAIQDRSHGNPLIAVQLARAGVRALELPEDTEALIACALDVLAPELRSLVRDLAVCGSGMDLSTVAGVLDMDEVVLTERVRALDDLLLVDRDGGVQFASRLVEQVAVTGTPMARRRELHADLVDAMIARGAAPLAIVEHAAAVELHEVVWRYGAIAARDAHASGAHADLAQVLEATLVSADKIGVAAAERGPVMLALADATIGSDHPAAAFRLYRNAIELLDDPRAQVRAATTAAGEFARLGRHRSAQTLLDRARRAIDEAELADDAALEFAIALAHSRLEFERGRYQSSAAIAEDVVARAGSDHDAERGEALLQLAIDYALLGDPRSIEIAEAALPVLRSLGRGRDVAALLFNLASDLDDRGSWDVAWPMYDEAERLFLEVGELRGATFAQAMRAEILLQLGDVQRAGAIFADVDRQARALSLENIRTTVQMHGARIAARTDAARGQAEVISALGRRLARLGERANAVYAAAYAVETLLLEGRALEALERADEARRRTEALGAFASLTTTRQRLRAYALWGLGRRSEARAAIDSALGEARQRGTPAELCFCLHAAGRFGLIDAGRVAELARLEAEIGVVSYPYFPDFGDPRVVGRRP